MNASIPYLTPELTEKLQPWPAGDQVHRVIMIENQNSLSGATYDALIGLLRSSIKTKLITKEEFIQMWKFLILEKCRYSLRYRGVHSDYVEYMKVPGPLFELLSNLYKYESKACGISLEIQLPVEDKQPWWQFNPEIAEKWSALMFASAIRYECQQCPDPRAIYPKNASLLLTTSKNYADSRMVRTYTNEATPKDGFIHFVNDDLFEDDDIINFDNSFLNMSFEPYSVIQKRNKYVMSFQKFKNS